MNDSSTQTSITAESSVLTPDQTNSYLPEVEQCLNCAAQIGGNFCSNCGQEATNRNVTFWTLIREIVNDYVNFDSKLWRSLKPLVVRPGLLTEAYTAGQRVRYIFPPRLYLMISIACFFVIANFDPITLEQAREFYGAEDFQADVARANIDTVLLEQKYSSAFESGLPIWMLFIIPLFALFLKLIYIRSKRFFVEHLIFAFHFFTFVFISYIPVGILRIEILYLPLLLGWVVYLFLAQRRVYKQSALKTGLKWVLASGAFTFLLFAYVIFVSVYALAWVLR